MATAAAGNRRGDCDQSVGGREPVIWDKGRPQPGNLVSPYSVPRELPHRGNELGADQADIAYFQSKRRAVGDNKSMQSHAINTRRRRKRPCAQLPMAFPRWRG